jgi:micrococcal nuclease
LLSVAIIALVVVTGVRAIVGGFTFGGDLLDTTAARSGRPGERSAGVVTYVLDGDTVQVTDGHEVRVRFLGIGAPEIPHPGKPGECYGFAATRPPRSCCRSAPGSGS